MKLMYDGSNIRLTPQMQQSVTVVDQYQEREFTCSGRAQTCSGKSVRFSEEHCASSEEDLRESLRDDLREGSIITGEMREDDDYSSAFEEDEDDVISNHEGSFGENFIYSYSASESNIDNNKDEFGVEEVEEKRPQTSATPPISTPPPQEIERTVSVEEKTDKVEVSQFLKENETKDESLKVEQEVESPVVSKNENEVEDDSKMFKVYVRVRPLEGNDTG